MVSFSQKIRNVPIANFQLKENKSIDPISPANIAKAFSNGAFDEEPKGFFVEIIV